MKTYKVKFEYEVEISEEEAKEFGGPVEAAIEVLEETKAVYGLESFSAIVTTNRMEIKS